MPSKKATTKKSEPTPKHGEEEQSALLPPQQWDGSGEFAADSRQQLSHEGGESTLASPVIPATEEPAGDDGFVTQEQVFQVTHLAMSEETIQELTRLVLDRVKAGLAPTIAEWQNADKRFTDMLEEERARQAEEFGG